MRNREGIRIGFAAAALWLAAMWPGSVRAVETQTVDAPIDSVTVYPDRAKVTRIAHLELKAGEHALTIENLPMGTIDASLRATVRGVDGITFLGLSHRVEHHLETPNERVAELLRQIRKLEDRDRRAMSDRREVFSSQKELVATMVENAGERMGEEVAVDCMDVSRWEAAYGFVGDKLRAVNDSLRGVQRELDSLDQLIEKVRSEFGELSAREETATKTVQIDLDLKRAGAVTVTLDYMLHGATWTPLYDARLAEDRQSVELAYNAEISQQTGEDWDDATLSLSTTTPSQGVGPGSLEPWFLATRKASSTISGRFTDEFSGDPVVGASVQVIGADKGAQTGMDGRYVVPRIDPGTYILRVTHPEYQGVEFTSVMASPYASTDISYRLCPRVADLASGPSLGIRQTEIRSVDALLEQVAGVQTTAHGEVFIRGGRAGEVSYLLDGITVGDPLGGLWTASDRARASLMANSYYDDSDEIAASLSTAMINPGALAAVFRIKRRTSVPSGDKAVRTHVARWTLNASLEPVSRPRNREGVYRVATVVNQDDAPLMPGPVALFEGGTFLGNARLVDLIVPGEELKLPFGPQHEIEVHRQLTPWDLKEKGNKVRMQETVKITLTNHGREAQQVVLEEPLPVSLNERVKVKYEDIAPEAEVDDDTGIATWTITLAPGEETTVVVAYRIEHPKNMRVIGL